MAVYHELADGTILTRAEFENYEFKAENNREFLSALMVNALPPKRSFLDTRADKLKAELKRLEDKRDKFN